MPIMPLPWQRWSSCLLLLPNAPYEGMIFGPQGYHYNPSIMALSYAEIQHLGDLLLSVQEDHVALAKTMLQDRYRLVLPQLKERAILYTLFHPEDEQFQIWVKRALNRTDWFKHPLYIMATALQLMQQTKEEPNWRLLKFEQEDWLSLPEVLPAYEADLSDHPVRQRGYGALYEVLQAKRYYDMLTPAFQRYLLRQATQHPSQIRDQYLYIWRRDLVRLLRQVPPSTGITKAYTEEVRSLYQWLFQHSPSGPPLYECGLFYEEIAKDYKEAEHWYQKGYALFPEHSDFAQALARLLMHRGDYAAAKPFAEQALQRSSSWGYMNVHAQSINAAHMGYIEWKGLGQIGVAKQWFQRALLSNASNILAIKGYSELLLLENDNWVPIHRLFMTAWHLYNQAEPAVRQDFLDHWAAFCEHYERWSEAYTVYELGLTFDIDYTQQIKRLQPYLMSY